MSKTKVFCFGFGQVAESFINKLINEKKDFDLSITSRQETLITGSSELKDSPWANVQASLIPVKEPGPQPTAITSRSLKLRHDFNIRSLRMSKIFEECC